MVAFSIALAGLGYAVGKTSTLMNAWSAGKSLQPPPDLGKKLTMFIFSHFLEHLVTMQY